MNNFHFGYSTHALNKKITNDLSLGWQSKAGTVADLAAHVKLGLPVCHSVFQGQKRADANFKFAEIVAVDIDNSTILKGEDGKPVKGDDGKAIKIYREELTIPQALDHPFIKNHCIYSYTSASHKPDHHKYRLVFLLPNRIADPKLFKAVLLELKALIPAIDRAATSITNIYFGNSNAIEIINNPDALPISQEFIDNAIASHEALEAEKQALKANREAWKPNYSDCDNDRLEREIYRALEYISPRIEGGGTYDTSIRVCWALAHHFGESKAIAIMESHSPSHGKWDVAKVVSQAHKYPDVELGSLFYFAKCNGYKRLELTVEAKKAWGDAQTEERKKAWIASQNFTTPINEVATKLNAFGITEQPTKVRYNVSSFVNLIQKTAENLTAKPRGFAAKIAPLVENISTNHDDVLMFKTGDRNRTYADLIKQGHRLIIDRSGTGKGKSHDAGLATARGFNEVGLETKGTVFLSNDYLNPTTTTLEDNRTVVPPRHGGQVYTSDVTPSGKKHLKRWDGTKNTNPDIVANCPEEHPINGAFTIARRKGIPIEAMLTTTTDEIGNPKTVNKICARCPLLHICEFKSDRRDALVHSDLMMHPQSQPNDPSFYEGKIAIVDEADKTLIPVEKVSATKAQILETAHWLKEKFPDISVIVDPILHAIATALDNLNGENYHGIEKSKLLPMLGILPDADTAIAMADEIIGLMLPDNFEESDRVNLDGILELPKKPSKQIYTNEIKQQIKLLNSPKSIFENEAQYQARFEVERDRINKKVMHQYDQDIAKWEDDCIAKKKSAKAIHKAANSTLGWEGKTKMMGVIENTPFNVIEPMLRAIATNGTLYLSRDNDGPKFNIALPNIRQQEQMTSYDATIFQSATMTATELRARLKLPDDYPIIEIAQEGTFDIIPNLKVVQVTGIGNTLRCRSDIQNKKLEALKAYAYAKYGEVETIGYKGQNDPFYFGKHDRGTNQFSGVSAMINAGFPLQNLGDKLAEYQVLIDPDASANSKNFMVWYYQQAIDQSIQGVGRPRATLHPQKEFVIYLATDIPLPSTLGGGVVSQVDVSELCSEFASATSENKKKIYQLTKEAIANGIALTQKIVADALGITQQAVSKTYRLFMQFAVESINLGINLEPISSNERVDVTNASEEIREVLDSNKTAIQKLKDIFDWTLYNIDDRLFRHVWACIGTKYQAQLLRLIGGIIPNWLTS